MIAASTAAALHVRLCDVAVASRARVRDAIVDIKSQIFDGETMLAQTVATTTRKQWSAKKV